jgi:hypothetical protein
LAIDAVTQVENSGDDLADDVIDEQARDMSLGGEFHQLEFRILKFRDGNA